MKKKTSTVPEAGQSSAPTACYAAAQCEWKNSDHVQCKNTAEWQHVTAGKYPGQTRTWKLCDAHKERLLQSYNKSWRAKEEPEWTPIDDITKDDVTCQNCLATPCLCASLSEIKRLLEPHNATELRDSR